MAQAFDYLTIPGIFMRPGDRKIIKELSSKVALQFPHCTIVHIGIGWGGSLYCSRAGAPHVAIYGVDIDGVAHLKGTEEQQRELNLIPITGDSRFAHRAFLDPIHFLYVDGDHTYEVLSEDIKNWSGKVATGGYIAFHDCQTCGWAVEVNRAIDDNLSAKEWEDLGISGWSRYFRRVG